MFKTVLEVLNSDLGRTIQITAFIAFLVGFFLGIFIGIVTD